MGKFNNPKMRGKGPEAWIARVKSGIYVSRLKYAADFDHRAVVSGIARTYSQRGIAVRSEPSLPGENTPI